MAERPIRLVISGCCGRMGSSIVEEAVKDSIHFELVGGLEQISHPQLGSPLPKKPHLKISDDLKVLLQRADGLIEFTTPEASLTHARIAAEMKIPMVIGTTGFSVEQIDQLHSLSQQIPIFLSPNMSIGIVIVRKMIARISELLRYFELNGATRIRISETHHAKKKDAPSGTAKQLAGDIREALDPSFKEEEIESKRVGDVVGIHSVTFQFGSEQIRIEHEAIDRRVFAQGALLVAKNFLKMRPKPGWYGMDDLR